MPRVAVLRLLVTALAAVLLAGPVAGLSAGAVSGTASAGGGRTWVVDAVDDTSGNRWESVDTGLPLVSVRVGDTVEWQFDRATQGHDLTSLAPAETWESVWDEPLTVYRAAGGEPVRVTFDRPGTYRYWCSLHGTLMTGTVVVVDPDGNTPPTAVPVVAPTSVAVGESVHTTAGATDSDGDVVAVSWDFGSGGAATYTDPATHAYTAPGSYVARLRVSDGRGGLFEQEFPITVSGDPGPTDPEPPVDDDAPPETDPGMHTGHGVDGDSSQAVVGSTSPAPAPAVDGTPPRISRIGPVRTVRGARPAITARVADRHSALRRKAIVLRLDGRRVSGVRYDARRGLLRWTPPERLERGRHAVRLVVRDTAGNRARRAWSFRVR